MKLKRYRGRGSAHFSPPPLRLIAVRVETEGNWSLLLLFLEGRAAAGTAMRLQPAVAPRRSRCAPGGSKDKGNTQKTCFFS